MSTLNVDKVDPSTGTALEIGSSGDTVSIPSGATLDISASTLTPPATMPASSAANLTNIPGANITGTIAAVSGANLTSLTATNLGSGTVPTARLGSGTASSSTVLYGDQTYKAEPGGGKILQVQSAIVSVGVSSTSTSYINTDLYKAITPASTSNKILILVSFPCKSTKNDTTSASTASNIYVGLFTTDVDGTKLADGQVAYQYTPSSTGTSYAMSGWASFAYLHSPSTTSAYTYRIGFRGISTSWTQTAFTNLSGDDCVGSMVLMEVDGT